MVLVPYTPVEEEEVGGYEISPAGITATATTTSSTTTTTSPPPSPSPLPLLLLTKWLVVVDVVFGPAHSS